MRQALTNLLNNAIKYTSAGKITLVCDSMPDVNGKTFVKFTVKDTGSGIVDEEVESIFNLFSRSSTHSKIEGLGVGLALSRKIANLLDGAIVLESTSDKGSSFSFYFTA